MGGAKFDHAVFLTTGLSLDITVFVLYYKEQK